MRGSSPRSGRRERCRKRAVRSRPAARCARPTPVQTKTSPSLNGEGIWFARRQTKATVSSRAEGGRSGSSIVNRRSANWPRGPSLISCLDTNAGSYRVRGPGMWLQVLDRERAPPRTERRRALPGAYQRPQHAAALALVGGKQLEHPVVGGTRLTGEV